MSSRLLIMAGMAVVASVLVTGCASMGGGDQFQNTVYDTHRRVKNLDSTLQASVDKLNQTSAELSARVDSSEQSVKAMQSTMEENNRKLAVVDKKLDSIMKALGRSSLAVPPPATGNSEVTPGPEITTVMPPETPASGKGAVVGSESAEKPAPAPAAPAAAPDAAAKPAATPPPATPAAPAASAGGSPDADYQQATRSWSANNYALAAQQFDAYAKKYPDSENAGTAMYWKSRALQNLNKYDEAVAEFEKFRSSNPTHARVSRALVDEGICYAKMGKKAKAQEMWQEVIKNYPGTQAADMAKTELKNSQ